MWEHSLGVSVAAGLLAGETPILKKEEAFVAGLLHDVGKVIMDNTRPEQIVILLQRVHEERRTFISLDQEIFGYTHPEMGFYLAENWGFPPHLCTVIRDHHSLDSLADSDPDIYQKALCQTVALSDALCARLGIGYREAMPDLDLHEEQWMEALRIDKIKYADLIDIFKETYLHEKISFLDL
jgi:putative nucleotidyltransferase with HDIG domain